MLGILNVDSAGPEGEGRALTARATHEARACAGGCNSLSRAAWCIVMQCSRLTCLCPMLAAVDAHKWQQGSAMPGSFLWPTSYTAQQQAAMPRRSAYRLFDCKRVVIWQHNVINVHLPRFPVAPQLYVLPDFPTAWLCLGTQAADCSIT